MEFKSRSDIIMEQPVSREMNNNDVQMMSLRFYDVLENIGASESFRNISRIVAVISEIISGIRIKLIYLYASQKRKRNKESIYFFGSFVEGTTTPGLHSDIDMLSCDDLKPVYFRKEDAGEGESWLIIESDHPGYVKLQYMIDGVPQCTTQSHSDQNIDGEGRVVFKNSKILVYPSWSERHGPAVTLEVVDDIPVDTVYALRCKKLSLLKQWGCRPCNFDRQLKELKERLASLDCFLVGVGVESSPEKHLQWRISFSLQERGLMFSLNPTQYKAYVGMKLTKKGYIEPAVGEESITSFQCKTCLFHAIEQTPPELWTPDNLLLCVRTAFMFMYMFLLTGHCPNYVNPAENLFHKSVYTRKRQRLVTVLKQVLDDWRTFPFLIMIDNINQSVKEAGIVQKISNWTSRHCHLFSCRLGELHKTIVCLLDDFQSKNEKIKRCLEIIKYLKTDQQDKEHTSEDIKESVAPILTYVHLQIAINAFMMSKQCNLPDQARRCYDDMSKYHFTECEGFGHGLSTVLLMRATVLYNKGEYGLCERIISQWTKVPYFGEFLFCPCQDPFQWRAEAQLEASEELLDTLASSTLSCLLFSENDIPILLPLVQFERCRLVETVTLDYESMISVDPLIYTIALDYLLRCEQNQKADARYLCELLKGKVGDSECHLFHRDVAYNILGWMYKHLGHQDEAVTCWTESLKLQSETNGASWHLAVLLFEQWKQGR